METPWKSFRQAGAGSLQGLAAAMTAANRPTQKRDPKRTAEDWFSFDAIYIYIY